MSVVLYHDIDHKVTISNLPTKLAQFREAIARHDHKAFATLTRSLSRHQAAHITLKYQAYFGELFFATPGFSHASFGSLSIYGSPAVNSVATIYETVEHEDGGDADPVIPSANYYGELIRGYFTERHRYDAECLYSSLYCSEGIMAKMKSSEVTLPNFVEVIELLCTRTDTEIMGMRKAYAMLTGGLDMFTDVLSFLTRQSALYQLVSVGLYSLSYRNAYALDLTGQSPSESLDPSSILQGIFSTDLIHMVNPTSDHFRAQVDASVGELLEASKGFAHREATFYEVLFLSSPTQLRAIAEEYKARTGDDLDTVIEEEFSGIISYALRLRYYFLISPARCYAWIINTTIKDFRDRSLLRALIAGFEDLYNVAQEFHAITSKSMRHELSKMSTGNFKRLLLALFDGNYQRLQSISS